MRSRSELVDRIGHHKMLAFLKRYLAYGRLKPIVTSLPRRLAGAFGGGDRYTFLQVKRVASDLELSKGVEPYAMAAACPLEELRQSGAGLSAEHYQQLRTELADLFDLRADFTVKDLLKPSFSQHHPAPENDYARSGPP